MILLEFLFLSKHCFGNICQPVYVRPNYAMKVTTVEHLALNLATGPVAPYFGC
jgi:hypothetical protein